MEQLEYLERLPMLRVLSLKQNPICSDGNLHPNHFNPFIILSLSLFTAGHRLWTIFKLPDLTVLDSMIVSVEEKTKALNLHDPSPHIVASLQHAELQKRRIRSYAKIVRQVLKDRKWLIQIGQTSFVQLYFVGLMVLVNGKKKRLI